MVVVLEAWWALVPFVGPYFHFGYTHDSAWTWTTGRGWLEVLPGVLAVLGGLVLLGRRSRVTASAGAWLALAAGAWFACGQSLSRWLHLGSVCAPRSAHASLQALESVAPITGLGAPLIFFAASALGRLSVRSLRDIHATERELEHEHTQQQCARTSTTPAHRSPRPRPSRAPCPVTGPVILALSGVARGYRPQRRNVAGSEPAPTARTRSAPRGMARPPPNMSTPLTPPHSRARTAELSAGHPSGVGSPRQAPGMAPRRASARHATMPLTYTRSFACRAAVRPSVSRSPPGSGTHWRLSR